MTTDADDQLDARLRALFDEPALPGDPFTRVVARRLAADRWRRQLALAGVAAVAVLAAGGALIVWPAAPVRVDLLASGTLAEVLMLTGACAWAWVWAES